MAGKVAIYRPVLAEVLGGKPTAAEQALLAAAKAGDEAGYGADRTDPAIPARPAAASDANRIRAALIRFLLLGGDAENPVGPRGVRARGAWIEGRLDFANCETPLDLSLHDCHFDAAPDLGDAHLGALFLPGCRVPGIRLQRLRSEGDVFLCGGFTARGQVNLRGARITGQLACEGGAFDGIARKAADGAEKIGRALDADAMTVGASVFLSGGFTARGQVNLTGARIAGQLNCAGGAFDGITARAADGAEAIGVALAADAMTVGAEMFLSGGFRARGQVRFVGARITGQLACVDGAFDGITARAADGAEVIGVALQADGVTVGTGFFWRKVATIRGGVSLTGAKSQYLVDDLASWQGVAPQHLSGFRYEALYSAMSVGDRVNWLARKAERRIAPLGHGARLRPKGGEDFDPGPYSQLARVLIREGRRQDAALILKKREHRLRRAEEARAIAQMPNGWIIRPCLDIAVRRVLNTGFCLIFGYGHAPIQALYTMVLAIAASGWFFGATYDRGEFAPNSAVVLTSADWGRALAAGCPLSGDPGFAGARAAGCVMPLALWTGEAGRQPAPSAADYETFQPLLYAFDLFVPLIDLGQTAAWAPSKDRGRWGEAAYYARMPLQVLGWIIAVVGAAVMTGFVGRRED